MASAVELPATESDYRAWLRDHPLGFVLNAWRDPVNKPEHTKGVMWHRAECSYLGPDWPGRFVTGDTIKACAEDHEALVVWAIERGEPLYFCKECRSKWLSEQR